MEYTYRIEQDEDAMDPRKEMENAGIMVLSHRRYNLPHEADVTFPDRKVSWATFERYMRRYYHAAIVIPIWGYDHSGLSIKAGARTYPFDCQWDSGMLGIIYITRETVLKEWGSLDETAIEQAYKCLLSEVVTYGQYLEGDVWGYIIEDEDGECIDSCWGFYGYDYCKEQAKESVTYHSRQDAQIDRMIETCYAL